MLTSHESITKDQPSAPKKPVVAKLATGASVIVRGDVTTRHAVVLRDDAPSPFAKVRYLDGTCETVHRSLVRPASP